jgi:glycosyltransferase involved in cell wall biosynthesis
VKHDGIASGPVAIDVSIVIPAYNSAPTLRPLLDAAVGETSTRWTHEVIVVDDASTDDTAALVRGYPGVRYLPQPENGGPARARNRGAREAAGDYVVFIDSDIVPAAGFLDRLMHDVTREPGIAGVSGVYAEEPLFNDGYVADYRNLQTHFWKISSPGAADDNFPVSLCVLRRSDFLEAGGLAERFRGADVEDFEFGRRMTARGARLLVSPRIVGHHHPEETFAKLMRVLFRRSRQYASALALTTRSPSHYATASRSLTLAGTLLTVLALVATPLHWMAWLVAAAAYGGLVVYPEAAYYRFLRERRPGVLFLFYCALQFLSNLALTGGLLVGAVSGRAARLTAGAR